MFKIVIDPQWQLQDADGAPLTPHLAALLVGIQRSGTLAAACKASGLTYRYAWGLLREGEKAFGRPLVASRRGRGAQLTALGERLAWVDQRIRARLAPLLDSLACEVEAEIEQALSVATPVLRMHASHGFAVELTRRALAARETPLDLKYLEFEEALSALRDGRCDLAGVHLPSGALEGVAAAQYAALIDADWTIIHLTARRQGLIVAAGNPHRIRSLADLARGGLRFVNRQPGSGTRLLFDLLLQQDGIAPAAIDGYDNLEFTHAAVAAYVGSGMADAGFGLEVPARRFGLDFVPLADERYFFLCAQPPTRHFLKLLRDPTLRAQIAALPGYDPAAAGETEPASRLFPRRSRHSHRPSTSPA